MHSLRTAAQTLARAIEPLRQGIARTLLSCDHERGHASHCESRYCLQCARWHAYAETCLLRQRLGQPTDKTLFATLTVASVPPSEIRTTAKAVIGGWSQLVNTPAFSKSLGWFRWVEIKADRDRPQLENVHIHSLVVMSPAFSGRNYVSRAEWAEHWHDSIGSLYRGARVETVKDLDAVTGYVCSEKKFIDLAELGIHDPQRYLARADQLKSLRRYAGHGALGETRPDEDFAVLSAGWRQTERNMARHLNSQRFEPIPVEKPTS